MKTTLPTRTIGADRGEGKRAVWVLDAQGGIITQELIGNTRGSLTVLGRGHPGARMVREAGMRCP